MRAMGSLLLVVSAGLSYAGETVVLEKAAADVPAVVQQAKKDASLDKTATQAMAVTGMWTYTDCKKFDFSENSPAESQPQDLRSETWLEECDNIPLPNPPGGGICIPRRRLLRSDMRTVKVRIVGRPVPGPKESFEVCLWAASLSLKVKQSPNKYDVKAQDEPIFNTTYILTPKK